MGINISQSKIIVFKNTYGYSTAISHKKQDGNYERIYINIQLPRGVELENKTMIEITRGFLSCYTAKDNTFKLKIIVMEYNLVENTGDYMMDNSQLPF